MDLDLYQAETTRIATKQTAILNQAQQILKSGSELSPLEQNGVLHALQILIENSIGKSKQLLKAVNEAPPVSAYDAFEFLVRLKKVQQSDLERWNSVIGLRNRIVHEYMNVDMKLITNLILQKEYLFMTEFLNKSLF